MCGTTQNLHVHHIFYNTANRKLSDQDGCMVYLCAYHHNASNIGVHFNKNLDIQLKKRCQKAWQEKYGTTEDFIKRYGKSWL